MKKRISKIALVTAMAVTFWGMTGCGNKEAGTAEAADTGKPAVAYMIAHTANSKPVDSSAPMIQETMLNCAENYGYAFITRVDGEPELVFVENLDIDDQFKNASKERLKRDACNKANNLLEVLDSVTAVYPEVDYLEGLRCAAASLRSLDESYTSRSIICCGSGLGTEGYMDCQNNLLSAEPQVIVDMLQEREALPDLSGITVYWIGMGQVAAPQEKLTPKQSKNLENTWKAVVEASGGEFVPNEYITVSDEMNTSDKLPSVSVVDLPDEQPIVFEPEVLEQTEEDNVFEEPLVLGESQVEFIGDKAEYLHPDTAVETIRPIAEYLMEHDSVPLLLVGSCAGDVADESLTKLSQDRAQTVKNTLCELGVDESRISTIGMGVNSPWHVKGAGYDGPVASSNRNVVMIDARTETATELMNNN